ncbi:MAG TPA: hypothetical protein VMB50_03910 [Myxococcales bacterium]|nr:hypothetical protein [Myxococcales bacterium]
MIQALSLVVLTLSASRPATPADDEARRVTILSIREYNEGDFRSALRDAKHAYELSGRPALLFNLGQCQRALGHWKEAEFDYRSYLRETEGVRNRTEVLALIAQMQAKERAAPEPEAVAPPPASAPAPAAAPAAPPPPETAHENVAPAPASAVTEAAVTEAPPSRRIAPATWWLGGSGVAAVVAGSIVGVLAAGNDGSVSRSGGVVTYTATGASYVTGQYEGLSADILWSAGGALVVAAVIVAFTSH